MLYFDTSFLTPLFRLEATSADVEVFIRSLPAGLLTISHWTTVEFSSMLAREVRIRALKGTEASEIERQFALVVSESFHVVTPDAADFQTAKQYLRRYESGFRAGDALHLAIAANRAATAIYSLDKTMLSGGRLLGLPVETGIRVP